METMMETIITLIARTFTKDSINQQISTETQRDVWCLLRSVNRVEWRNAAMQGLQPEYMAIMPLINYSGEIVAVINNVRYAIYRTYINFDRDEIELYLAREVGA